MAKQGNVHALIRQLAELRDEKTVLQYALNKLEDNLLNDAGVRCVTDLTQMQIADAAIETVVELLEKRYLVVNAELKKFEE